MNIREGTRQGRIEGINKYIEKRLNKEATITYNELLAWICMSFSVSRRTAKDYVDPLFVLNKYQLKEDIVSK